MSEVHCPVCDELLDASSFSCFFCGELAHLKCTAKCEACNGVGCKACVTEREIITEDDEENGGVTSDTLCPQCWADAEYDNCPEDK